MTGQLVYCQSGRIIAGGHDDGTDPSCYRNKWTRVIFEFADGGLLFFNDLRTFGYLKLIGLKGLQEVKRSYGPDPLSPEFEFEKFKKAVKGRKTNIKAVLLNQSIVAGLGNIYVDEVLFAAKIKPTRKASGLKTSEIEAIYRSIKPILEKAIKHRGTTFNTFVDGNGQQGGFSSRLKVYGRAGEKCRRCGTVIEKTKVAGRGTHYCPVCQV